MGGAVVVIAAAFTLTTTSPAGAAPWGTHAVAHQTKWGTNPKKQPKPQPWYHTVYTDDFKNQANVLAWTSPLDVNDPLQPTDSANSLLQKPTTAADVTITKAGSDNYALQVATKANTYLTTAGQQYGLTSGRVDIGPNFDLANHVVSIRMRVVGDPVTKSATMIFPQTSTPTDWPWEFDMAETIPGFAGASSYHHVEQTPGTVMHDQLASITNFNPYVWHTYTVEFLGGALITGIEYLVDGQPLTFIEDSVAVQKITAEWAPTSGTGHIAIGKAIPAGGLSPYANRAAVPLSHFDAVQVDWVHILAH